MWRGSRILRAMAAEAPSTRTRAPARAVLSLSDRAAARIRQLLAQHSEALGVRVGVRRRGCNGLSYTLDYAHEVKKLDEVVEDKGVRVVVDGMSVMHLLGTTMDWVEDRLRAEFVFSNPNAKSSCGCGESFNVE